MCSGATGNVFTTQSGMSNYNWNVTGGTITAGSGTNSITATLIASGVQTVSVNYTDANGCTAATATAYNVTVNGHTPVITGYPNNSDNVSVGDTDQYSTPLIPGDLYSWSASGEIGLCSGEKNCISVNFVNPCCIYGVWTIYVTETNPGSGCSATSSKDVTVNP